MKKNRALLVLLLMSLFSFAQAKLEISYDESLQISNVQESTAFTISGDDGITILKGKEINSYKFKKPGTYSIKVDQKEAHTTGCDHHGLPSEITVNVSRIKMEFDGSKIKFSSPIRKNAETSGIILSIPISIHTYDNKPVSMDFTPVSSAGIGSSITATLSDKFRQLSAGKHWLTYNLNGVVNQNSYLMFDFIDANGKVQSISLQSPIEN